MAQAVSTVDYTTLLNDVRIILEEGKVEAQRAVAQTLVQTYWEVGRRVVEEGILENRSYGEGVVEDLSRDLNIDLSTLKRCIYFFQIYNSATSSTFLTWSHYKYLLSIENDEERQWYEAQAEEDQWNVNNLANAIKENRYADAKPVKGKKPKQRPKKLKRPEDPTYIYKAYVKRVIDGDTLLLLLDLGFTVFKEQRVRLNFIDAPDLSTKAGAKAYEFVRKELSKVEFVMVKTNKIDIYGRYLGDVFYSRSEVDKGRVFTNGRYLSQELVNQGLAKVV